MKHIPSFTYVCPLCQGRMTVTTKLKPHEGYQCLHCDKPVVSAGDPIAVNNPPRLDPGRVYTVPKDALFGLSGIETDAEVFAANNRTAIKFVFSVEDDSSLEHKVVMIPLDDTELKFTISVLLSLAHDRGFKIRELIIPELAAMNQRQNIPDDDLH